VAALQDRLRLAYVRYRGGVDTQLNALDADRDLFQAELALAQIRLDEQQSPTSFRNAAVNTGARRMNSRAAATRYMNATSSSTLSSIRRLPARASVSKLSPVRCATFYRNAG
jgi:hypothetical protein